MAPIKLEDHIREQFEEREILPSAGAWGKLEAKLDKEPKKKGAAFFWHAIAASIVGVVLIASQFIFNENSAVEKQLVEIDMDSSNIETPSTSEILKTETLLAEDTQVNQVEEILSITETQESKVGANKNKLSNTQKDKRVFATSQNKTIAVQTKGDTSNQNISEVIDKASVINNKVSEVVAVVQDIQREKSTVTAAEIDALLVSAQRELATQRMLNETKIDATALLNDVEFELEKSFRDKVFDALGDSFSKIRTAVVERNN